MNWHNAKRTIKNIHARLNFSRTITNIQALTVGPAVGQFITGFVVPKPVWRTGPAAGEKAAAPAPAAAAPAKEASGEFNLEKWIEYV